MPDPGGIDHDIGGKNSPRCPQERVIGELALRQHGVVSRQQLLHLGFSRRAVDRLRTSGWLRPVHRGVYATASRLDLRGQWFAALLACGPSAVLSHRSAAALWGLLSDGRLIDVTTTRSRVRRSGIVMHRIHSLNAQDRAVHEGIPVTSVARTLLDLAAFVVPRRLERAVEQAERLGFFDLREVERLEARSRGRAGWPLLRATLEAYREPAPTRSEFERRFLALCRQVWLPAPAINVFVAGHEVDAVWYDQRLVVELDGHEFHRTRAGSSVTGSAMRPCSSQASAFCASPIGVSSKNPPR
jgi:Transcriptional regulator, AbiEi antitoxin